MNYPRSAMKELAEIEDKYDGIYGEPQPHIVRIQPFHERKAALRTHSAKPAPTPPKEHHAIPQHLRDILSFEVVHTEKGLRSGEIVRAEHSLDQVLGTLQDIGEILVKKLQS